MNGSLPQVGRASRLLFGILIACTQSSDSVHETLEDSGGVSGDTVPPSDSEEWETLTTHTPPDSTTETAPSDLDTVTAADTESVDAQLPQWDSPSSNKSCMCWPNGDVCDFEGLPHVTGPVPEMRCPDGEICEGGPQVQSGVCRKPCFRADAEHSAPMACPDGEYCKLEKLRWGFENQYSTTIAYCWVDQSRRVRYATPSDSLPSSPGRTAPGLRSKPE